jgi:hypothetical protein
MAALLLGVHEAGESHSKIPVTVVDRTWQEP